MPPAEPAATVLVLRESDDPFEVLMVERNHRGFFGSIEVFPGGRVETIDMGSRRTSADELSHRRAALRELAEESGIALTTSGALPYDGGKDHDFYEWLARDALDPDTESLVLVSRWVTPEEAPSRFDTVFYIAAPGPVPPVLIDTEELVGYRWTTPARAIARYRNGEAAMVLPTLSHLRWLSKRSSIEDAISSARGADGRTLIEPRRGDDGSWHPRHRLGELV